MLGTKAPHELTPPELLEIRIRLEKRLAASLGAAAARFIVEDRFTLSTGEAERLVESFQELRHSLQTTEEEARHNERLLASVVRSVDDCIVTTDTRGRLVTVNPAGERLFGASQAELAGAHWWELLGAGASGGHAGRAFNGAYALEGGGPGADADPRGICRRTWPSRRSSTRAGRSWARSACSATSPSSYELQRRLIQQETLASLGQMAAGVAHEIRNPLGGIKMAMAVLSKHGGDTLSREMTESMRSGVVEIEAIVSHLLDYTRETRLDRQPFDVERIMREVVRQLGSDARTRGVALSCQAFPSVVVALVDGHRLRQVLMNVVHNAIEAVERRSGGRVEVTCHGRDGTVVFEVTDNGVGMTPEEREPHVPSVLHDEADRHRSRPRHRQEDRGPARGRDPRRPRPRGGGRGSRSLLPAGVVDEAASADRRG